MFVGLVALMYRRFTNPRVRAVTTRMDIVLELLLLAQVVLGCGSRSASAGGRRGSRPTCPPTCGRIVTLTPETGAVFAMPWVIKLHILGAFAIMFVTPFTRLAHFIVAPLHYIVRPYQRVIWNWDRKTIRDPGTPWTPMRPRNN